MLSTFVLTLLLQSVDLSNIPQPQCHMDINKTNTPHALLICNLFSTFFSAIKSSINHVQPHVLPSMLCKLPNCGAVNMWKINVGRLIDDSICSCGKFYSNILFHRIEKPPNSWRMTIMGTLRTAQSTSNTIPMETNMCHNLNSFWSKTMESAKS